MVTELDLPVISLPKTKGFRLVNSKLPTIDIFNDVASPDEFQDLYDLQALTNPVSIKRREISATSR